VLNAVYAGRVHSLMANAFFPLKVWALKYTVYRIPFKERMSDNRNRLV